MSLLLALLTSTATLTGSPADASIAALDAVAVPGAVSTTGDVASSSLTALDGVATPGAVSTTGSPATMTLDALDAVAVPGPVSTTGGVASATLTALDAVAVPGAVSLTGEAATATVTAHDATAVPGAVTVSGSVASLSITALDGVAGYAAPRSGRLSLALVLPVRAASVAIPARSLSVGLARRSLSVSIPARSLALTLPRRSLVASVQSFTKGDACTATFTISIDTGTISEPTSLAAQMYPVGSTTLATSISVTPGDCTGWGTASVSVPVAFTSANAPTAGRYSVEIVATYVDGTRRWPDNATSPVQLDVKAPGAP